MWFCCVRTCLVLFYIHAGCLPDPLEVQSSLSELLPMLDDSKFSTVLANAVNTSLSCEEVLKAKVVYMYHWAVSPTCPLAGVGGCVWKSYQPHHFRPHLPSDQTEGCKYVGLCST